MTNRLIKFRAYYPFEGKKGKGKMIEHNRISIIHHFALDKNVIRLSGIKGFSKNDFVKCEEAVIMQFSGIKDRNNVDVYEGDIVQRYFMKTKEVVSIVVFKAGAFRFKALNREAYADIFTDIFTDNNVREGVEVLGNIYENADLFDELLKTTTA